MRIAAVGLIALSGLVWAAPDLNESYTNLKAAVEKKDATQVKALAAQTSKDAKEVEKEAEPAAGGDAAGWKGRQEFAKQAADYSEYALSALATENPASLIDLSEALIAQNPKSKYVDTVAPYYLDALNKQSPAKANAAAQKILAGNPDQPDALLRLAGGNPQYANRLVQVMRTKAKPDNMSEADWESRKNQMIVNGTYMGAVGPCSRSSWADCDRSMRAAEPTLKGTQMIGTVYFYLGVANYQLGTLTGDKSKQLQGLNYSKQAAATPGPMQGQATGNVTAMSKALGTR
jgi:hypothetical protein